MVEVQASEMRTQNLHQSALLNNGLGLVIAVGLHRNAVKQWITVFEPNEQQWD
jgi:hypothetical protein